ncbi:MAG: sporulation protein YqfD [Clostridia bacterium]|nr:sporulation protein YqfD [Clostridia bacterium]
MFLKIWLNYVIGYVNIKVESYYLERFINICISKKIFLWNIKRNKSSLLYASISIRDYKKLKQIAKKTKSRIKIQSKKGIPFVLHKYRKRKIFLGLLILVIIGLIITSNFIWNIEIEGNTNISKEEIIEELKNQGLKIGINKNKIDTNSLINKIRLNRDDIAWVGINLKGTNAIIEIKEKTKAPEIIDETKYCNIISNKTAMITKMNVQNGTANVRENDIVKDGDVLVLGYLEGKYTGIRYVHAKADIQAKVWYTKKEKFYLNQRIQVPTGATEEKYTLNVNNFKINFYKTLSKFKNYDTINENKKLVLFSNFYLPIEIIKTTNYEYENQDVTYTEEELKTIAIQKLEQELVNEIQNKENIINKQINVYGNEGYIEVEVIYEVLENIGIEDEILF